jgi:hypothetical protein
MDDYERTVKHVRTEDVIEDPLAVPAQPAYPAQPAAPAQPVYTTPPVYTAPTVAAATPMAASRDRIVTDRAYVSERPSNLEMARRIVTLVFGILQGLLILRIILLLLVANRANDIVQLILGITGPFVTPFADMFSLQRIGSGTGAVLDVGAIVALIGWTIIELLIFAILNLGARRSRTTV